MSIGLALKQIRLFAPSYLLGTVLQLEVSQRCNRMLGQPFSISFTHSRAYERCSLCPDPLDKFEMYYTQTDPLVNFGREECASDNQPLLPAELLYLLKPKRLLSKNDQI